MAATCWVPTAALAAAASGCASVGYAEVRAQEVADGVYMLRGADGEVDPANHGRIGNAGFIVGPRGVIAIDTGTSYAHGRALLAAIARVTAQPVRQVFITHARQEFLFGGAAFRERGIPIHMQQRTARLMTARCEGCLKTLNRVLGTEAMRGTTMFKADVEFDEAFTSEVIGRPVRVMHFGHSSGPGDLAVFDPTSGTLFAGGLVDHLRVPDVQDCEMSGWRRALQALGALDVRHVVPGHGGLGPPGAIGKVVRYLDQLEARLLKLLRADVALSEVADSAALPEFESWDQYAIVHRRNASILFVRMERDELIK